MSEKGNNSICGLPSWAPIPSNDSAFFVSDVIICVINIPLGVFAFVANLAVIIAVIKTPSLQRPCNVLLCSLATIDCVTGLVAQPLFVAWRLMIHRIHESCDHQVELFTAYRIGLSFLGWSFANITLISFDRHYAIAKPLKYRTNVTNKGALLAATITGTTWLVLGVFLRLFNLSGEAAFDVSRIFSVMFVVSPVVNHVGIFIAIRRHNKQVAHAVSGPNASLIMFRREKKATSDMIIVIAVLSLCLCPVIAVTSLDSVFTPSIFEVLYVWSHSVIFINSSINPVIYLVRNREIRSAVKLMIC